MKKDTIKVLIKRGTVIILLLSVVCFFLPYKNGLSALKGLRVLSQMTDTGWLIEGILGLVVPVVFTLLAALMIALRHSIPKCVIASVFSIIALVLYTGTTAVDLDYAKSHISGSYGLVIQLIIAVLGIILPIGNIVAQKVFAVQEE
jgi:hypothetical protein